MAIFRPHNGTTYEGDKHAMQIQEFDDFVNTIIESEKLVLPFTNNTLLKITGTSTAKTSLYRLRDKLKNLYEIFITISPTKGVITFKKKPTSESLYDLGIDFLVPRWFNIPKSNDFPFRGRLAALYLTTLFSEKYHLNFISILSLAERAKLFHAYFPIYYKYLGKQDRNYAEEWARISSEDWRYKEFYRIHQAFIEKEILVKEIENPIYTINKQYLINPNDKIWHEVISDFHEARNIIQQKKKTKLLEESQLRISQNNYDAKDLEILDSKLTNKNIFSVSEHREITREASQKAGLKDGQNIFRIWKYFGRNPKYINSIDIIQDTIFLVEQNILMREAIKEMKKIEEPKHETSSKSVLKSILEDYGDFPIIDDNNNFEKNLDGSNKTLIQKLIETVNDEESNFNF